MRLTLFSKLIAPLSAKAFLLVAEDLSFTVAAKKAGMTQSGISKHISRLEEQLEVDLFDRRFRKVVLTKQGVLLKKYLDTFILQHEEFLSQINSGLNVENNIVRFGIGEAFLYSEHYIDLLKLKNLSEFFNYSFHLSVLEENQMEEELEKGHLNIGIGYLNSIENYEHIDLPEKLILCSNRPEQIQNIIDLKKYNLIGHKYLDFYLKKFKIDSQPVTQASFKKCSFHSNDFRCVKSALLWCQEALITPLPESIVRKEFHAGTLFQVDSNLITPTNKISIVSSSSLIYTDLWKSLESHFKKNE